ncbi:MAG: hypothetical protein ABEJ35_04475 [Halobacteriaceae archaeon]
MSSTRSAPAERVVVSYPADLSDWGRWQLDERSFKAYLRRNETAAAGDVWDVFLDVGCCGDTYDVPLRVERVDGGQQLTPETEFVYEERGACGLGGGWSVQSAAGPTDAEDGAT